MYIKNKYKNIVSRVDDLTEKYLNTKNEGILSIIKYELYKIVKLHIEETGLQRNEYAYSTGLLIINDVINDWIVNYEKLEEKSLANKLISTLKKMPLRKKVYHFNESVRKEDDFIQRYSYIVDKTMLNIRTLEDDICYELLKNKYEEIAKRLLKQENLKNITKIAPAQLFQFGLSKKREIFKTYKSYLRQAETMLENYILSHDEKEQVIIKSYCIEIVKKYFTSGHFYNGYNFEKYLFEELSKLNLSKIDGINEMYNESKRIKYKPKTRV